MLRAVIMLYYGARDRSSGGEWRMNRAESRGNRSTLVGNELETARSSSRWRGRTEWTVISSIIGINCLPAYYYFELFMTRMLGWPTEESPWSSRDQRGLAAADESRRIIPRFYITGNEGSLRSVLSSFTSCKQLNIESCWTGRTVTLNTVFF